MIIYLITNIIDGKQYVGQTTESLNRRWKRHCVKANSRNNNMVVSRAIKKYGRENFTITQIDSANSLEELNAKEQYHINRLKCCTPDGYNVEAGGSGPGKMSEELRLKHSKTHELISPEGRMVEITNLYRFCLDNGLDPCYMNKIANGRGNSHKGWRSTKRKQDICHLINRSENKRVFSAMTMGYQLTLSDATGLHHGTLSRLINGHVQCVKGWEVEKIEHLN